MRHLTYAIGDIHGRLDLLDRLLDLIEADAAFAGAAAKIVFLGDYVDRGAASRGVVERLIAGPRRALDRFVCLRGNHDELFVKAATSGDGVPDWAWELFRHTIRSYGLSAETPWRGHPDLTRHATFLAGLPLLHDDGVNLFVHAGIRPGIAIEDQTDHDLVWIRDDFLDHAGPLPRRVVHGHTIMGDDPVVTPYRVSVDTGAFRSGRLTAAVLDDAGVRCLQAVGEPDRGAMVREALLAARISGRPISPLMQASVEAFLAGRIDVAEFDRCSRTAMAA